MPSSFIKNKIVICPEHESDLNSFSSGVLWIESKGRAADYFEQIKTDCTIRMWKRTKEKLNSKVFSEMVLPALMIE